MPLDALPPDQRAVVQLVLQRERSYAQIAELLKISEDAVRARAHAGLSALAPDVELPADKLAQIADFLLGQQNGKPRQATRRLLRSNNGAREWAETVRAQLEDVGGASLPALPAKPRDAAPEEPAAARAAGADAPEPATTEGDPLAEAAPATADTPPAPRPRPLRDKPQTRSGAGPAVGGSRASGAVAAASSRVGGAVLIGLVILALVGLALALFVFDGDDDAPEQTAGGTPTPTATPSATPAPVGEIRLRGVNGSKGTGVMRLYSAQGQVAFTLEGTGVPQNRRNEAYAVWFTTPGGGSQRLGFAQPVGADGRLGTTGPRTEDLDKFPRWFARYRQVVVSRERDGNARSPGPIVLRGTVPRGNG
jgi:hypothetical protein